MPTSQPGAPGRRSSSSVVVSRRQSCVSKNRAREKCSTHNALLSMLLAKSSYISPFVVVFTVLLLCAVTTMTLTKAESSSSTTTTKTVYFIRHAESEENRRIASLSRVFKGFTKFSLPSSADIYASTELLNVAAQVDSNVSEVGAKQIAQMGETLQTANFLVTSEIQLVAHSPLLRARETSQGMLGCLAGVKPPNSTTRVVKLDLLIEKTPAEWNPINRSFKQRIADFEQWLADQNEKNIAIVGHSQYFKAMFGLDFKFGNCDVWKATLDLSKRGVVDSSSISPTVVEEESSDSSSGSPPVYNLPPQWSDLEQMYECQVRCSKSVE